MQEKENIIVTKDCPLIVSNSSQTMEYGIVVLEKGACIQLLAGSLFSIDVLTRDFGLKNDQSLNLKEYRAHEDFPEPADGWTFDIYVSSKPGRKGIDGGRGGSGGSGGNGGSGSDGGDGDSHRPNCKLVIYDLKADISVVNIGGTGGKGGYGGDGGDGSDSGKGGDGGNGGNGGNGAKGCNLTIAWKSSTGNTLTYQDEASDPGEGGMGGLAGKNGDSYQGSTQPKNGDKGHKGLPGALGKTVIQKL